MKMTKANEDYLEAILMLEKKGSTKSVDVAAFLGVSKAAVSMAMNDLIAKGAVDKQNYGEIKLTPMGRKIATETLGKHKLIHNVLIAIGVSEETAEVECCKIEHILSDETLECLKKTYNKFKS